MAKDCKYLESCPLFQQFQHAHGKVVWIGVYCRGDSQEECERLKMRERGEKPAPTMLPNGMDLNEVRS